MDIKSEKSWTKFSSDMWVPTKKQALRIVEEFGSPTFVYNTNFMSDNFWSLRNKLSKDIEIYYSMKANPSIGLTRRLGAMGAGAEVCSLAELQAALHARIQAERIIFVGPAKSRDELEASIKLGINAIVCESFNELNDIESIAKNMLSPQKKVRVMLRINPEFTGEGSGLAMGGKPRQFGIDESQLRNSIDYLSKLSHVDIIGFHIYMGTRYLDAKSVIRNTRNILSLVKSLEKHLALDLRLVDIGGGLGVPYFKKESSINLNELTQGLNETVQQFKHENPQTCLIMELGRYLVAGSGVLITKIRDVKTSMGESFAIADGGTNLHMAAVGIGSFVKRNFPISNVTSSSEQMKNYNVTGPLCTPNDTLAKHVELNEVSRGDILAVMMSGAYGPSASPTGFLSHGYPAEIILEDGALKVLRRRESVDDILRPQLEISLSKEALLA